MGCVCFYMAFFMYEDEQGQWQNRLDEFWISIHDRARLTRSKTVALFNKVAEVLMIVFSSYFGKRVFSLRAALTSINLSIAVLLIGLSLADLILTTSGIKFFDRNYRLVFYASAFAMMIIIKLASRQWGWLVSLISSLPVVGIVLWLFALPVTTKNVQYAPMPYVHHKYLDVDASFVLIVLTSFLTDIFAIAIIRKTMAMIAKTFSPMRIICAALIIGLTGTVSVIVPHLMIGVADMLEGPPDPFFYSNTSTDASRIVKGAAIGLSTMNLSTMLYCLVPGAILLGLLLHRLIWPLLSRLLYPLSRYSIIARSKSLAAVGALCFTFAFNLEKIGIKEILKMLS